MRTIYIDKLSENTSREPIRFFDQIVLINFISLAKESFYSYVDFLPEYVLKSIDEENELFIVEYNDEIGCDEFTGPDLDWKVDIYKFTEELDKYLKINSDSSIRFIKNRMDNEGYLEKSKKESIKNIIQKIILRCSSIRNDEKFKNYSGILLKHYSRIISYIYHAYPIYAPKETIDISEIKSIYKGENFKPELKMSFFDDIINLKDSKTKELVFDFDNNSDVKTDFRRFYYQQYDKINKPLNIKVQKTEVAYYFISKLCHYLDLTEARVFNSDIFTINGKVVTVNLAYTAKNRIKKRKHSLSSQIDNVFEEHLS